MLKDDSDFFEAAGIIPDGNWEGRTVLHRQMDDASLAARFNLNLEAVHEKLADSHSRLLSARASRVRPATYDKVLTAWNRLMLSAFAEASRVIAGEVKQSLPASSNREIASSRQENAVHRNDSYYNLATRNAEFLNLDPMENYAAPDEMDRPPTKFFLRITPH